MSAFVCRFGVESIWWAVFVVVFACGQISPACAMSAIAVADSFYHLGARALAQEDMNGAEPFFVRAIDVYPKHALAHCGLGHVYLKQKKLDQARAAFRKAERYERKLPEAYLGLGLVYAQERGQWVRAIDYFCRALAERPDYVDAQYHIGMTHLRLLNRDAIKAFEQVIEMNPHHLDAYYRLGYLYEVDLLKKNEAVGFYEKQLAVNPSHQEAMWRLGQLYRSLSRTEQAAKTLSYLMRSEGANQRQYMLELAEVYLEQGEYDKAETLFDTYLANLLEADRKAYEDISLIAKKEELEAFETYDAPARKVFLEAFWKRRDPTPITDVNERRVEHFRRVSYALEHYGKGVTPWDRRGDVYIRFGAPDHQSASGARKREFLSEVRSVKQRLLNQAGWAVDVLLKDDAQTSGDSLGVTYKGAGVAQAQRQLEGQFRRLRIRRRQNEKQEALLKRAELEMATGGGAPFLGRPVFPIRGHEAWEYWTYVDVAGGVEIVFRQLAGAPQDVFDYAHLPEDMSIKMRHMWSPLQPEKVVQNAVVERYVPQFLTHPLSFAAYPATFRGTKDSTRVEVYFGFRASELTQKSQEVQLQHGAVLYDIGGNPVYQTVAHSVLHIDRLVGVIPDVASLMVAPGSYYLAVQAVVDKRTQVYSMPLLVRAYTSGQLALSDIELAAVIGPAKEPGKFVKQDLQVIPLATRFYTQKHHVYFYYEIYGLTQNGFGKTDYQIVYTLRPKEVKKMSARILAGVGALMGIDKREEVIRVSYDQTGEEEDVASYLAIDLAGSDSGEYVMTVVVMDRFKNETTSRTTTFKIE